MTPLKASGRSRAAAIVLPLRSPPSLTCLGASSRATRGGRVRTSRPHLTRHNPPRSLAPRGTYRPAQEYGRQRCDFANALLPCAPLAVALAGDHLQKASGVALPRPPDGQQRRDRNEDQDV